MVFASASGAWCASCNGEGSRSRAAESARSRGASWWSRWCRTLRRSFESCGMGSRGRDQPVQDPLIVAEQVGQCHQDPPEPAHVSASEARLTCPVNYFVEPFGAVFDAFEQGRLPELEPEQRIEQAGRRVCQRSYAAGESCRGWRDGCSVTVCAADFLQHDLVGAVCAMHERSELRYRECFQKTRHALPQV